MTLDKEHRCRSLLIRYEPRRWEVKFASCWRRLQIVVNIICSHVDINRSSLKKNFCFPNIECSSGNKFPKYCVNAGCRIHFGIATDSFCLNSQVIYWNISGFPVLLLEKIKALFKMSHTNTRNCQVTIDQWICTST